MHRTKANFVTGVESQLSEDPDLVHRADIWGLQPVHWAATG